MSESSNKAQKLYLSLDYRWITIGLLALVVIMLLVWKPWAATATDRTIDVTGQTTVSARPDEFVFYPQYEFKNSDRQAAISQLSAKSDELVAALKNLGVADKDIKTNSSSWSYPIYKEGTSDEPTYTLQLTVTIGKDELAQKVQDYLVTTSPSGAVSPQANFSESKRKELEDQARDEATKDARKKAEQSGKNLGFKIAAVKSVVDSSGFGVFPMPYAAERTTALDANAASDSLSVQPGENELTYTVTVIYYIK